MADSCVPENLLYRELFIGRRPHGRLYLHFKDVCKSDMKTTNIEINDWEKTAENQRTSKQSVKHGMKISAERRAQHIEERRSLRKNPALH